MTQKHVLVEPGHRGRGADDVQPAQGRRSRKRRTDGKISSSVRSTGNSERRIGSSRRSVRGDLEHGRVCDDEQALRGADQVYRAMNHLSRYLGSHIR